MSCPDCLGAQSGNKVAFYRWSNANILLVGCHKHLGEVMTALRAYPDLVAALEELLRFVPAADGCYSTGGGTEWFHQFKVAADGARAAIAKATEQTPPGGGSSGSPSRNNATVPPGTEEG